MKYHKLVENAVKPEGFWGKLMIRSMNKGHSKLTDWALSFLKINRNDNILDVGCGGGKTVAKLCEMVGNGSRDKRTSPMLYSCKITFPYQGKNISFESMPEWN